MLDFTSSNLTQLLKRLKAKPSEKLTFKLQKLTKIHRISGTWTHKPLQLFLLLLLVLQHRLLRGRRWLAVCWQQLAISRQVTAPQKLHLGCVSAQLSAIKTFQNKSKSSQISLMGKAPNGSMAPSWTLNFTPFPLHVRRNSHLNILHSALSFHWSKFPLKPPERLKCILTGFHTFFFVTPSMTQQKKETRKHTCLMETGMESILYVSLLIHD